MKPFNLEEAKAGKRLVCRDGTDVEFIGETTSGRYGEAVAVCIKGGHVYGCSLDGELTEEGEHDRDVFMWEKPKKPKPSITREVYFFKLGGGRIEACDGPGHTWNGKKYPVWAKGKLTLEEGQGLS